jgi:G3E family GTPase
MKIHLVGGFSGSGKSTAIANTCKVLADRNISASVIKDDGADYVVDTRPAQKFGVPFAKVTGGCFCCNYNQLDFQIDQLKKESNPAVIFAEYSGSCTNLIASLLKPLIASQKKEIELANFSTFVDAQLLLKYLEGAEMPLSVENKIIWGKHLLEAEILIVNKIDLLSESELETLRLLTQGALSSKQVLFQNSHDAESVNNWIETVGRSKGYYSSSAGEVEISLLDEEIELITKDHSAVEVAYDFMNKLSGEIIQKKLTIDHLKFLLSSNKQSFKLDYTEVLDETAKMSGKIGEAKSVYLLVNARIQTSPDELRKILLELLAQFKSFKGVTIKEKFISYFQP